MLKDTFGEIHWDDIENGSVAKNISKSEHNMWIFVCIFIVTIVIALLGIGTYSSSSSSSIPSINNPIIDYSKYTWLNRCTLSCQQVINVDMLDRQKDCTALQKLTKELPTNYVYEWHLGIDDRSSSLGCTGYPKNTEDIKAEVKTLITKQAVAIEQQKIKEREQLLSDISNTLPRFNTSLQNGGLIQYVSDTYIDAQNSNEVIIIVKDNWTRMSQVKRLQLATVIWQKWANINTPKKPNDSLLRITDTTKNIVGGSKDSNGNNIWVQENLKQTTGGI